MQNKQLPKTSTERWLAFIGLLLLCLGVMCASISAVAHNMLVGTVWLVVAIVGAVLLRIKEAKATKRKRSMFN